MLEPTGDSTQPLLRPKADYQKDDKLLTWIDNKEVCDARTEAGIQFNASYHTSVKGIISYMNKARWGPECGPRRVLYYSAPTQGSFMAFRDCELYDSAPPNSFLRYP